MTAGCGCDTKRKVGGEIEIAAAAWWCAQFVTENGDVTPVQFSNCLPVSPPERQADKGVLGWAGEAMCL